MLNLILAVQGTGPSLRCGERYFKGGYRSKLTTELLTRHTCPFLSAKSNNKLVIRGHLLLPDNTHSEQERSVGGQPGIWAAAGSAALWAVSHLTQSRRVPPVGLWWLGGCQGFEV